MANAYAFVRNNEKLMQEGKCSFQCATCKKNPASHKCVYYGIPFCSEECYDAHSPYCSKLGHTPKAHWVPWDPPADETKTLD